MIFPRRTLFRFSSDYILCYTLHAYGGLQEGITFGDGHTSVQEPSLANCLRRLDLTEEEVREKSDATRSDPVAVCIKFYPDSFHRVTVAGPLYSDDSALKLTYDVTTPEEGANPKFIFLGPLREGGIGSLFFVYSASAFTYPRRTQVRYTEWRCTHVLQISAKFLVVSKRKERRRKYTL